MWAVNPHGRCGGQARVGVMMLRAGYAAMMPHVLSATSHCKNPSVGLTLPVVLAVNGYRVRILGPPREHPPPHVHVSSVDGAVAVVRLRLPDRPARIWRHDGMTLRQLREVMAILEEHTEFLLQRWSELHGGLEDLR